MTVSNLTTDKTLTRTGRIWSVTGKNGAVSIELISAGDDVFGPIVIHSPTPLYGEERRVPMSCDVLDGGVCHADVGYRAGADLGKAWESAGRDDKVIWRELEQWYADRLNRN